MTSGTRGKRSHAAGESKPSRPTAGEQGEPEPNRGGREERKMALFEQGERERERDRASTDRFYCGTKRSRVRSILFSFFVRRGIDEERTRMQNMRQSVVKTLDDEEMVIVGWHWTTRIVFCERRFAVLRLFFMYVIFRISSCEIRIVGLCVRRLNEIRPVFTHIWVSINKFWRFRIIGYLLCNNNNDV